MIAKGSGSFTQHLARARETHFGGTLGDFETCGDFFMGIAAERCKNEHVSALGSRRATRNKPEPPANP